jgi:prepilin-type N-terminal cleavage/methylation domain-containing protein
MRRKKNNYQKSLQGFTIVELLIASAVFSTVLLVALTGFLEIGRLFYKGVSNTQVQDTNRQVVNDISSNITATAGTTAIAMTPFAASHYKYFCAGAYRYTYSTYQAAGDSRLGHSIEYISSNASNYDPGTTSANMGLVKDRVGSGFCPAPCVSPSGSPSGIANCSSANCGTDCLAIDTNSPTELLGNGMRIGNLSVAQAGTTNLFNMAVAISYGDDSVLDFTDTPPSCTGNSNDQKFCAVSQLTTSIARGGLRL